MHNRYRRTGLVLVVFAGCLASIVTAAAEVFDDGRDLSHVEVRVVDKNGVIVPDSDALIEFDLKGPGKIADVDNGDLWSTASYKGNERKAHHGRCLVIVRSQIQPGRIQLTASANGLARQEITLISKALTSSSDE